MGRAAFILGVEGAHGQDTGHRQSSPPASRALFLSPPLLQPLLPSRHPAPNPGCQLHSPSPVLSLGGHSAPSKRVFFMIKMPRECYWRFVVRAGDAESPELLGKIYLFPYPHSPHSVTPVSHSRSHSQAFARAVLSAKRDFPLCQPGPLACTEKEFGLSLPAAESH